MLLKQLTFIFFLGQKIFLNEILSCSPGIFSFSKNISRISVGKSLEGEGKPFRYVQQSLFLATAVK